MTAAVLSDNRLGGSEFALWTVAGAVALAVHAGFAAWMLSRPTSAGIAPTQAAVMIEMAPVPTAPASKETQIAPDADDQREVLEAPDDTPDLPDIVEEAVAPDLEPPPEVAAPLEDVLPPVDMTRRYGGCGGDAAASAARRPAAAARPGEGGGEEGPAGEEAATGAAHEGEGRGGDAERQDRRAAQQPSVGGFDVAGKLEVEADGAAGAGQALPGRRRAPPRGGGGLCQLQARQWRPGAVGADRPVVGLCRTRARRCWRW